MRFASGVVDLSAVFLVTLLCALPACCLEAGEKASSVVGEQSSLVQFRDADSFISSAAAVFSRLSEMGMPSSSRPGPLSLLRTNRASGVSKRLLFQSGGTVRSMPVFKMSLTDRHSRKNTIDALEDHVMDLMTQEGVTPMVVSVANDTVGLVRDTVMPMIFHEHETDEALLDQGYMPFVNLEAQLAEETEEIYNLSQAVLSRSETHVSCRNRESSACALHSECQLELEELRVTVEQHETSLTLVDSEIERTWCDEGGNRLVTAFQSSSVAKFTRWSQIIVDLEIARSDYDDKDAECQALSALQDRNRTVCDDLQQVLEETTCNQGFHVSFGSSDYYQRFEFAATAFDTLKGQVRVTEADRKVEYRTLMHVMCLLAQLTNPEHGSASSEETAREIASCHTLDVDTSPLDLVYRDTPEPGTFPGMPEVPCNDAYLAHEYGDLPQCTEAIACNGCPTIAAIGDVSRQEFVHCCTEPSAECYACQAGQTVDQFCSAHHTSAVAALEGCPEETTAAAATTAAAVITTPIAAQAEVPAPQLTRVHPRVVHMPHMPHLSNMPHHMPHLPPNQGR